MAKVNTAHFISREFIKGKITTYTIKLENGEIKRLSIDELKDYMRNNELCIPELTLTSDNRLLLKQKQGMSKDSTSTGKLMSLHDFNKYMKVKLSGKQVKAINSGATGSVRVIAGLVGSDAEYIGIQVCAVFDQYGDRWLSTNLHSNILLDNKLSKDYRSSKNFSQATIRYCNNTLKLNTSGITQRSINGFSLIDNELEFYTGIVIFVPNKSNNLISQQIADNITNNVIIF